MEKQASIISRSDISSITPSEILDRYHKSISYPSTNPPISIKNPHLRSTLFSKHVLYIIYGQDSLGKFEVHRRYKEFLSFRKVLVSQWPGCSVPQIPPKQKIGNLEPHFVESRRGQLEYFLLKIVQSEYLYSSEECQQFIRGDKDFHKSEYSNKTTSFKSISDKYLNVLSSYIEFHRNSLVEREIGDVLGHLNKGISNLDIVAKCCSEQFSLMMQDSLGLERLVNAVNNTRTYLEDITEKNTLKAIEDPFNELVLWCKNSSLLVSGIIESIYKQYELQKTKSQMINKLEIEKEKLPNIGKKDSKIRNFFKKKPKEFYIGKCEAEIESLEKDIESLQIILDVTSALIINNEYPRFKNDMKSEFQSLLKKTVEKYEKNCFVFVENLKQIFN